MNAPYMKAVNESFQWVQHQQRPTFTKWIRLVNQPDGGLTPPPSRRCAGSYQVTVSPEYGTDGTRIYHVAPPEMPEKPAAVRALLRVDGT